MNSREKEFTELASDILGDLEYLFDDSDRIPKKTKIEIVSKIFESFYALLWSKIREDEED